jgi:hypothetical protein
VDVPWSLGPVPLRLHCSRGRAWSGRCRVSRFQPLSNRSSLGFRRRRGFACQLSVRIAARVFTLSDARNTLAACGGGGQTLASPTRAARIPAAVLPTSSAQPFVSQCEAGPPLSPIALPTSRLVDSAGFDPTPHHLDRQDRRCDCFRPSSRATTARRSLRGERWPLSSEVGTPHFYVARHKRTSASTIRSHDRPGRLREWRQGLQFTGALT